ncbi:MAG: RNA 2'-phosphotransferase [Pseudomonadota bacterium]|nr:RNA 2'-phosphotransferase [Pseudomonadota bacterium]
MRGRGQGESPKRISKFLALILRHNPGAGGISLDAQGWADVEHVLAAVAKRFGDFDRARLEEVVRTNDKSRYAFNEAGDKIRANQGHSVPVNLALAAVEPPPVLYHGTVARFLGAILEEGLIKGKRHHVHLSPDVATALNVAGRRSGETVVLEVQSGRMRGHSFFRSANCVWLTDHVPPEFLRVLPLSTPPR